MFALGGNILVVDEGVGFCRSLAAKLGSKGYKAEFSFDVTSAVGRVNDGEIDLVVMSCAGETPCLELIEAVRNLTVDIPVLAFEAPECGRNCRVPDMQDVKIVTLGSWDVQEATQHVCECIEELLRKAGTAAMGNQLLFVPGKQVDVQIQGINQLGNLTSTILHRDDQYLYLSEIKDSAHRAVDIPPRASLKVGVAGKDAHYSFSSQVVTEMHEPDYMLQMGKPVVIYRTQRRKHPRFSVKLPVNVAVYGEEVETDSGKVAGTTQNISRGGMKITVPDYIAPGEAVMLNLMDQRENTTISGMAYVLKATPNPAEKEGGFVLSCRFSKVDDAIDVVLKTE